jgi:hypothetical protein
MVVITKLIAFYILCFGLGLQHVEKCAQRADGTLRLCAQEEEAFFSRALRMPWFQRDEPQQLPGNSSCVLRRSGDR